ncbi:MAG: hypothetical protein H6644_13765 [Caldilineaceae bacterium]|nr:hypothetical protein [Caldilineaceae bacterium]
MTELILDFDEEFFWHVDHATAALTEVRFRHSGSASVFESVVGDKRET